MSDSSELLELADQGDRLADDFARLPVNDAQLEALSDLADRFGKAWSGSNLGYHAFVYYRDFEAPPPGSHFSVEWGLERSWPSRGTSGDWVENSYDSVRAEIRERAGSPPLEAAAEKGKGDRAELDSFKQDVVSALTVASAQNSGDQFLTDLLSRARETKAKTYGEFAARFLGGGQIVSRDMLAITQGSALAPHQSVIAEVAALRAPAASASELALIVRQAGSHIGRLTKRQKRQATVGTNVFIGHGQSPVWRDLKDFVSDRLHLPYDEFNRVPVAGVTNISRLSEMMEAAALAFLVLTAEDEQSDGTIVARQNVVHEAGLFQGRLGFSKAIILLEEGCQPFSNIDGLGQIRFPKGNIQAKFEEVRRVLEREGLLL